MRQFVVKILIGIIISYGIVCTGVWLWQRALIYAAGKDSNPLPSSVGVAEFQPITITAQDGIPLQAWWAPPKPQQPVIMYFHGNAGNITERGITMRPYLEQGYGIFLLEYRGYAGNPGTPSETAFYQDAQTALDFVKDQHIPEQCIVIYGESLGSGVATQMAITHDVGALILLAPISSLSSAAHAHYPFLPTQLLLRERYDNVNKIAQINMPLLILHSEKDKVVPMREGQILFDKANQPKVWKQYPGNVHAKLVSEYNAYADVIGFIQHYVNCRQHS